MFSISSLERLNAMLKKLFSAQITGDVHEELVKAAANGKLYDSDPFNYILLFFFYNFR